MPLDKPTTPSPTPWHRYGYVWLLLAGPLLVIIAGIVTAWIAWKGQDPVIQENHQRHGAHAPAQRARNHSATPVRSNQTKAP